MLRSSVCTFAQLRSPDFQSWCGLMGRGNARPHRKDWELAFIAQALFERSYFGKSGIGFGVGHEPLPALLAEHGCGIMATDMPANVEAWEGQHCESASGLARYDKLSESEKARLSFRGVDMRSFPPDLGQFDFCWSTSALEHLGSLEAGEEFIRKSLACLRPGGMAVHVTEHAIFPVNKLPETGGTVWYSSERLKALMAKYQGGLLLDYGHSPEDFYVDHPPYGGPAHLKLMTDGFVATSVALIIAKA